MALRLLTWAQALRNEDGSYWTGMVYPEEATFPSAERIAYTAGAIVLAADALSRTHPGGGALPGRGAPQPPRPHRAGPRCPGRAGHAGTGSGRAVVSAAFRGA